MDQLTIVQIHMRKTKLRYTNINYNNKYEEKAFNTNRNQNKKF